MGNNSAKLDVYRNDFIAPQIAPYVMNAAGGEAEPEMNRPGPDEIENGMVNPGALMTIDEAEHKFSPEDLAKIKKEFERLSKDNVIGKRKLLEYFKLLDI